MKLPVSVRQVQIDLIESRNTLYPDRQADTTTRTECNSLNYLDYDDGDDG